MVIKFYFPEGTTSNLFPFPITRSPASPLFLPQRGLLQGANFAHQFLQHDNFHFIRRSGNVKPNFNYQISSI